MIGIGRDFRRGSYHPKDSSDGLVAWLILGSVASAGSAATAINRAVASGKSGSIFPEGIAAGRAHAAMRPHECAQIEVSATWHSRSVAGRQPSDDGPHKKMAKIPRAFRLDASLNRALDLIEQRLALIEDVEAKAKQIDLPPHASRASARLAGDAQGDAGDGKVRCRGHSGHRPGRSQLPRSVGALT